jgi:hypothetical protein
MTDDKTHVGEPDRSRLAGGQDYEVRYLAEQYGLSVEQARDLIARFGNDRQKLDEAAKKLLA